MGCERVSQGRYAGQSKGQEGLFDQVCIADQVSRMKDGLGQVIVVLLFPVGGMGDRGKRQMEIYVSFTK